MHYRYYTLQCSLLICIAGAVQQHCMSWQDPHLETAVHWMCLTSLGARTEGPPGAQVPEVFREDLFAVLGERARPDYRWLIMGPQRSGSSFHKDPNATSAWNAVVRGSKKWILFPPHIQPPGAPLVPHPLGGQEFVHLHTRSVRTSLVSDEHLRCGKATLRALSSVTGPPNPVTVLFGSRMSILE